MSPDEGTENTVYRDVGREGCCEVVTGGEEERRRKEGRYCATQDQGNRLMNRWYSGLLCPKAAISFSGVELPQSH
jgi:hypothetical protein